MTIPKIIHFVYIHGGRPFSIIHMLSVYTAYKNIKPDKIYLHVTGIPNTPYFKYIEKYVTINKVENIDKLNGNNVWAKQHKADYIRLNMLYKYGGIYTDLDILHTKPFDVFLDNHMVMCYERPNNKEFICNAVIMVEKESHIIKEWIGEYENSWGTNKYPYWMGHSAVLPVKLNAKYPDKFKVLPNYTFYPFLWTDFSLLRCRNGKDYSDSYGIHLWETESEKAKLLPSSLDYFDKTENTFVDMFRSYIYELTKSPDMLIKPDVNLDIKYLTSIYTNNIYNNVYNLYLAMILHDREWSDILKYIRKYSSIGGLKEISDTCDKKLYSYLFHKEDIYTSNITRDNNYYISMGDKCLYFNKYTEAIRYYNQADNKHPNIKLCKEKLDNSKLDVKETKGSITIELAKKWRDGGFLDQYLILNNSDYKITKDELIEINLSHPKYKVLKLGDSKKWEETNQINNQGVYLISGYGLYDLFG